MKLRKALKRALDQKCGLTRKAWQRNYGNAMYIEPVCKHGNDIRLWIAGQIKASGWEPEAGDILATDWQLVKL